jgi:transposase
MWNPTARAQHSRAGLRYGSDMTDAEWAIVAPLLPKPSDRGRRRRRERREPGGREHSLGSHHLSLLFALRGGQPLRRVRTKAKRFSLREAISRTKGRC